MRYFIQLFVRGVGRKRRFSDSQVSVDFHRMRLFHVFRVLFFAFFFSFSCAALSAQTIKLASPLPEGTEWHNALLRMANDWREITGGRVRLRIYPGGIAGNEADMVRKMRFGQLDAGVFSAFGLKAIVPETFVFTLPGLLRSEEELDYVLEHFLGRFDERFREEGFEIGAFSKTGWAYIFGPVPIHDPDDLKRRKVFVDNTDTEMSIVFKSLGFNVVPVGINEIAVSLQSGLADTFYAPPVGAAAYQWFAFSPYMTDFRLTPVIGGIVLTERAWSRIPEQYHEELKAAMERMAASFYSESIRLNEEALAVMEKHGLQHVAVTDEQVEEWTAVMRSGHELMVGEGRSVPTEVYEDFTAMLEGLRD